MLAGVAAVILLAGGLVGYRLTHRGEPSFRRGGQFAAGLPATTTSATTLEATTSPPTAADPSSTTASSGPAATAPTTVTTRRAGPTTTAATRARTPLPTTTVRHDVSGPPTTRTSAATTAAPPPAGPRLPAFGTYTYAVDGSEGASFFGSRRYPDRMTMVVHGASGLAPDQVVLDLRYSDQHEEREIVSFKDDGIYFDFEGGSVTFGPRTETSEADYEPPMIQIPKPLSPGLTRSATVQAKSANGSVMRTEDVKVTVVGQETVSVAGANVATWKVEVNRQIRPGSADQGTRSRTYWFDPARNLWVKFAETFHGERNTVGFRFTYDSNLTAVLAEFKAG